LNKNNYFGIELNSVLSDRVQLPPPPPKFPIKDDHQ